MQDVEYAIGAADVNITEPQGNIRDFLMQDYNVKEVEDVSISELKPFNTTGPEYDGISEIVKESQVASSEELTADKKGSVYISSYHTYVPISERAKLYVCVKPENETTVRTKLCETKFYKNNNYSDNTNINSVLKDAYTYTTDSNVASVDKNEVNTVLHDLLLDQIITLGFAYASNEDCYSAEKDVCNLLKQKLDSANVGCAISINTTGSEQTKVEMAESASKSGAGCHIIISGSKLKAGKVTSVNGWCVYYLNDASGESEELASIISDKLSKGSTKVSVAEAKCKLKDTGKTFKGIREVEEYFGRADYFPTFNYSTVPVVIVCMGVTNSDSTTVINTLEKEVATAIKAAILEWSK